jgi:adenosylhomocysteine nucleosidase
MKSIIIVISANTEWQVIRESITDIKIKPSPYGEWFETSQFGKPLIFFHQGWGKIAAAGATQYVIDRWEPDLLINLGTCGGFAGEIEKYTIILAEKTIVYDIVEKMGDYDEALDHYSMEIDLSGFEPPYPQDVIRTLLVSGDRDLLVDEIPVLKARYGAIAGDWESGAITWVADKNNVRCLILRGVTDLVGSDGGEAYDNSNVFIEGTRIVMKKLLDDLPKWILY